MNNLQIKNMLSENQQLKAKCIRLERELLEACEGKEVEFPDLLKEQAS
ncbi:MAG: hypothetical protein ACI9N9_002377 [Enterobacterales bacterium]|jgi:hypothetical protein